MLSLLLLCLRLNFSPKELRKLREMPRKLVTDWPILILSAICTIMACIGGGLLHFTQMNYQFCNMKSTIIHLLLCGSLMLLSNLVPMLLNFISSSQTMKQNTIECSPSQVFHTILIFESKPYVSRAPTQWPYSQILAPRGYTSLTIQSLPSQ